MRKFKTFWVISRRILKVVLLQRIWISDVDGYNNGIEAAKWSMTGSNGVTCI